MNAPIPQLLLRRPTPQDELPLATDGAYRVVWESRFGDILIEVVDGVARVNGQPVEPAAGDTPT
jgi:hypothetical protein